MLNLKVASIYIIVFTLANCNQINNEDETHRDITKRRSRSIIGGMLSPKLSDVFNSNHPEDSLATKFLAYRPDSLHPHDGAIWRLPLMDDADYENINSNEDYAEEDGAHDYNDVGNQSEGNEDIAIDASTEQYEETPKTFEEEYPHFMRFLRIVANKNPSENEERILANPGEYMTDNSTTTLPINGINESYKSENVTEQLSNIRNTSSCNPTLFVSDIKENQTVGPITETVTEGADIISSSGKPFTSSILVPQNQNATGYFPKLIPPFESSVLPNISAIPDTTNHTSKSESSNSTDADLLQSMIYLYNTIEALANRSKNNTQTVFQKPESSSTFKPFTSLENDKAHKYTLSFIYPSESSNKLKLTDKKNVTHVPNDYPKLYKNQPLIGANNKSSSDNPVSTDTLLKKLVSTLVHRTLAAAYNAYKIDGHKSTKETKGAPIFMLRKNKNYN